MLYCCRQQQVHRCETTHTHRPYSYQILRMHMLFGLILHLRANRIINPDLSDALSSQEELRAFSVNKRKMKLGTGSRMEDACRIKVYLFAYTKIYIYGA